MDLHRITNDTEIPSKIVSVSLPGNARTYTGCLLDQVTDTPDNIDICFFPEPVL